MALIGTLRNKMGTWVVVFVFVAIACFILGDLFSNNSYLFNNDNEVGEIAGHTVTYEEFQAAVQERENNFLLNTNRQPTDREMINIRQQAWELLILRHAIEKQYDKVGVEVTVDEEEDMIYGKNVDQNIKQAFTDESGQFNKDRLLGYLKELSSAPADPQLQQMWQQQRTNWEMFQRDLRPGRARIKYENLLLKSNYVTKAEAEREYHLQNDVAEVKFLYVPFYAVSDSAATPTDADFQDYYNKNIDRYKTEETRDAKYVEFPVQASAQDSLEIRQEVEKIASELAQSQDDSTYAASNSDGNEPYGKFNVSSLPSFVQSADLQQGKVIGPFVDGDAYKVVKLSRVYKDTIFNARAKHILIKWDNPTPEGKQAAKEKARGILKELKGGADFAIKAREHGTDGTASRGGDLGWFSTGRMVKPFEDAVFGATKPGLLNDVVETDFGYHIIFVSNVKDNSAYEIATIERKIAPSDATTNSALRKAESFAADLKGATEFEERAKKEGYSVYDAKRLTAQDRNLGNIGEARPVVQWLFREAEVDKVSEVFDLQDKYVVAVMTGMTKKGNRSLEVVKEEITPEVRKVAKARVIIEKLKTLNGTLEEIASQYGSDASIYNSTDLKLSNASLPAAGFDPETAGAAFALENGKRTAPFQGLNGVFIMELQNKTVAPAIENYATYKEQLEQGAAGRSGYAIGEAIKADADIEDARYKFY